MSEASIKTLTNAWVRITEETEFPPDYEGSVSPDDQRASAAIQKRIDKARNNPC